MRVNPSTQSGVTLTGLILTLIVLALVAIFGMRVVPDLIEYGKIQQNIGALAKDTSLKEASVAEIRKAFDRRADIDQIDTLKGTDIEISKENGQLVLSFAYTRRIPMAGPVSLLIDFEGSTAK